MSWGLGLTVPFLHSLKDVVPSGEACLYDHINWTLAQTQQQSSIDLSQSPCKRGGKTRPWTQFHVTVQKRPLPGSSGASLAKRPHLESGTETHPGDKKSAGSSVSSTSADARRKGPWGSALLICQSPQPSYHPHLQFFRLVCFPFLDQREALLLTGLCLIWFGFTIFSLGHTPTCFVTFGSSMWRWLQLIIPLFRRRCWAAF